MEEFWLNEGQAIALVSLLRTPKARAVRIALVKLFMAWRRGETLPAPSPANAGSCLTEAAMAARRTQFAHPSARWGVAYGALARLLADVEVLFGEVSHEDATHAIGSAAHEVNTVLDHIRSRRAK